MEFPHNRIFYQACGRDDKNSKDAVVCNNKNRRKIKRMHGDIIDFYQYIGACNV